MFALHSKADEAAVIARAPQLVKVCSSQFVGELVKRALPGCALTHLPVPPPAISARVDTQYFGVSKAGTVLGPHPANAPRGDLRSG